MEKANILENARLVRHRRLLPLLALAFFLVLLGFAASARPAYAADSKVNPMQSSTGGGTEGGGGGGTPTPVPDTVMGYIYNSTGGQPVVGIYVNLIWDGDIMSTTTNNSGWFVCQSGTDPEGTLLTPTPNTEYIITVNGVYYSDMLTGNSPLPNPLFCQWAGNVVTDNTGWALINIRLQPATAVLVPAAALYGNTNYTQSIGYTTSSSHDLNFKSEVGGTGFETSQTWTVGITWTTYGKKTAQLGRRYYAVGFYDQTDSAGSSPVVQRAGISAPVDPLELFRTHDVQEYLSPDLSKPNYGLPTDAKPISLVFNGSQSFTFRYHEVSSFTWSYGASGSVGINFACYGISVNIDITATVTSGYTNTITFQLGPLPAGSPDHEFVIYTRGFSFTEVNDISNDTHNKGGLELHVWDMGVVA
jgi:hypothetical protein